MSRTTTRVLGSVILAGILGLLPVDRATSASLKTAASMKTASNSKKSSDAKARSRKRSKPTRRRLPKYFAQLKLDDDQRQQILDIQERYADRLVAQQELMDETRKQLDQLRKDEQRDYNRILKTSQKRRLKELRNRSKRSAKRKSKK